MISLVSFSFVFVTEKNILVQFVKKFLLDLFAFDKFMQAMFEYSCF